MANKGWDSQEGGSAEPSNARQSGRLSSSGGGAEAFIHGSRVADPGGHNDPLDTRGDVFGPPGQLSTC